MNENKLITHGQRGEGRGGSDDNPRTVPISRRQTTLRNRRGYFLFEPIPLTEDEIRQLPVAHQYSA